MTAQSHVTGRTYTFRIGDRVRAARECSGLDQAELAALTGISRQTIGNYERGLTAPRRPQVAAIALATGFDMSWLRTGRDPLELVSEQPPAP